MCQTELKLSEEDSWVIEGFRSKGWHQAREVNRAHVLSCLDRNIRAQRHHDQHQEPFAKRGFGF